MWVSPPQAPWTASTTGWPTRWWATQLTQQHWSLASPDLQCASTATAQWHSQVTQLLCHRRPDGSGSALLQLHGADSHCCHTRRLYRTQMRKVPSSTSRTYMSCLWILTYTHTQGSG
jgi:hypothetical protein